MVISGVVPAAAAAGWDALGFGVSLREVRGCFIVLRGCLRAADYKIDMLTSLAGFRCRKRMRFSLVGL